MNNSNAKFEAKYRYMSFINDILILSVAVFCIEKCVEKMEAIIFNVSIQMYPKLLKKINKGNV